MKLKYLSICILLNCFIACNTVYVPNTLHEPMLKNKGDINLNISPRVDIQAAYAISDEIGVMANVFSGSATTVITSNGTVRADTTLNKGYLFEAGVGYTNKFNEYFAADMFVGGGVGNVSFENNNELPSSNKKFSADASKIFFQPGAFFSSDFFDVAANLRLSIINFKNPVYTNYTDLDKITDKVDSIDQGSFFFMEPAATVKAGYKFIKAFVQVGKSYNISDRQINNSEGIVSYGINLKYNF